MVLAAFGSFLGYKPILYVELMVVCKGLELAIQLRYSVLEVESDSAMVMSWIHTSGSCSMGMFLFSAPGVPFGNVIPHSGETCSSRYAADFLANWACTHRTSRCFLSLRELPKGLSGILYLDTHAIPHVGR